MDGETYGCVKIFCYLGDTLDGADFAATARIRNGQKQHDLWKLLVDVGLKFERAEMQMIRWMRVISMKDRRTTEELRRLVGVELTTTVIRSGRLRWYGHHHRFILSFPIGLNFLLITLPFQGC